MKKFAALLTGFILLAACGQGYQFGLGEQSQSFKQEVVTNNQVDLVFVVDNSRSMSQQQSKLAQSIPGLIDGLLGLKMDLHIAVLSTSTEGDPRTTVVNGGKFLGDPAYFTNSSPNLKESLKYRLLQGEVGSNLENGLDSIKLAFSNPHLSSSRAAGFLRNDARLVIIVLSDDNDKKTVSTDTYINFLNVLKPPFEDGSQAWLLNYIGLLDVDEPACRAAHIQNDPGIRYMELSGYSGGVNQSICANDFTSAVSNIRARVIQIMTDYYLQSIPDLSTIQVFINGTPIPKSAVNGWQYIPQGNFVRLYGNVIPSMGADVKVLYMPANPN